MSNSNPSPAPGTGARGGFVRRHARALSATVVVLVAAAVALGATDPFASPARSGASIDNAYPTSTTTIKRETITSQTDVSASLGYSGSFTVTIPSGTGAAIVATDEATVAADRQRLGADEAALTTAKKVASTSGAAALAADRATVTSDTNTLAVARTQLAEDEDLGCPVSSSSTVTTAAGDSSGSSGSSSSDSLGDTGATAHVRVLTSATSTGGTAASTAPSATTGSASSLTPTSETLSGTVDPGGLATSYYFRYGTTSALAQTTATYSLAASAGSTPVSVDVTGLFSSTPYEFELVATNSLGTATGEVALFSSSASSCTAEKTVIAQDRAALASAKDALGAADATADETVTADERSVATDESTLSSDESTLSKDRTDEQSAASTFTSLPPVGAEIGRGERVYSLDDRPVPLIYGTVTLYRALFAGEQGADVRELQENLLALGYGAGLVANGVFGASTTAAVRAFQRGAGDPVTGVVDLGDVVLAPGPLRVTSVSATDGSQAQPAAPVLDATSTARVVSIALDANLEGDVRVGDPVEVTLPSGARTPGVVSSVGTVATAGEGTGSTPTVAVLVSLTDPSAAGDLDDASVEVAITTGSAKDALVVPVDALLALASGGYALEEVTATGSHVLVGVTTGIFDDAAGLVSVTGSSIAAGEKIVVPAL